MAEEQQHEYKFNITMSCGGCSGAVDRVLKKLDGKRSAPLSSANNTSIYKQNIMLNTSNRSAIPHCQSRRSNRNRRHRLIPPL